MNIGGAQKLTVHPEEVVEQLEKRETVPALRGLDLQGCIHVDGVKGQEVFCMLHHEVSPPCKRLETQREGKEAGEHGLLEGRRSQCVQLELIGPKRKYHQVVQKVRK